MQGNLLYDLNMSFKSDIFEVVRHIPEGKTLSYGEVAKLAGYPRAARAVGAVLKTNFDLEIPCHRVIKADGALGGYNRGIEQKKDKLRLEGALD